MANEGTQPQPSSNGVKPSAPAAAPVEAKADPLAEREAQLKAREEAITAKERKYQNELKKNADEKKGLGAKLSRLNELEKREQFARLNPPEYLKGLYGEKWHEVINTAAINGVPPADLIASEMQKMRDEFRSILAERDAKTLEQSTAAEKAAIDETRAMVASDATAFYESNAKDYPVFEKLGSPKRVGEILGQRIEQTYLSTGKLISAKDAADGLESDMLGIVETAVAHEKYKTKLQDKLKPAIVPKSVGAQESAGVLRRTLSNNLTASTPGRTPPRSDAERTERAIQAFNAVRAKNPS